MKLSAREIVRPTLVLVVICLVVTAALAGTNLLTRNAIVLQNAKQAAESRKEALPGADSFEKAKNSGICYIGKNGTRVVGYVFDTEADSYGGKIQVMTGIDRGGKVTGVVLVSTNDTPGLGLNAQKQSFRDQYEQQIPQGGFQVIKNGSLGGGRVDAITGATITSRAVTSAVNQAVTEFQKVKGGE